MRATLSVIIPTFNEAANIAECISSVTQIADQIIVMDNFSNDGTADIALSLNAQVYQRTFDNFSSNKNAAIEKATNEWLLLLDADERLTSELRAEIEGTLNQPGANAYRIKRDTFYKGKKVRCWSSDSVIRLFRKNHARFDPHRLVHEELIVNGGTISTLQHPLQHYTFRSFDQYLPKVHSFTSLAALQALQEGKRSGWAAISILPPARFLRTYLLKGGVLDGVPGLMISCLSAYTVFLKMAKLWELQNSR